MFIKKEKFQEMQDKITGYEHKIKLLEDQTGIGKIRRLRKMIEELEFDPNDEEVNSIKKICFFDVAGNVSSTLKGYSQGAFVNKMGKDTINFIENMKRKYSLIPDKREKK